MILFISILEFYFLLLCPPPSEEILTIQSCIGFLVSYDILGFLWVLLYLSPIYTIYWHWRLFVGCLLVSQLNGYIRVYVDQFAIIVFRIIIGWNVNLWIFCLILILPLHSRYLHSFFFRCILNYFNLSKLELKLIVRREVWLLNPVFLSLTCKLQVCWAWPFQVRLTIR